jgi:hypothetical protein
MHIEVMMKENADYSLPYFSILRCSFALDIQCIASILAAIASVIGNMTDSFCNRRPRSGF